MKSIIGKLSVRSSVPFIANADQRSKMLELFASSGKYMLLKFDTEDD